jgi:2-C-methyl-D-erythritol 4-phosphate cytidylyltransferase
MRFEYIQISFFIYKDLYMANPITTIKKYAIIVAGGSGTRMNSAIPKQFLVLNGLPVLIHTLNLFNHSNAKPQLILVLNSDYHEYWKELCKKFDFKIPHKLVKGGDNRFQSVKNGLEIINDEEAVVAIHDAVRPLTPLSVIDNTYIYAEKNGNAITAIKSRDSIRQIQGSHSISLLRDDIYLIQTPQTFKLMQLKKAYKQTYSTKFTDDASVVESSGEKINLTEGSYENIKITFPEDIAIAEAILNKKPLA